MKRIFFALVVCASALAAGAAERIVRATGTAASQRAALNGALVSAMEKVTGITVSNAEAMELGNSFSAVTANGTEDVKNTMLDTLNAKMSKSAEGRIKSYEVISQTYDERSKAYTVEIEAKFEGKYEVGLPESNRRRMAVAPFRVSGAENYAYGDSGTWSTAFTGRMNELLTQSRKFTMLDRNFDAEVDAELNRTASGNNASSADFVRLNQKLGTDYLIVGEITFLPVNMSPIVNPLTGQSKPAPVQVFAEIKYRVILAPTGQLKWSNTYQVLTDAPGVAGPDGIVAGTAKAAAASVSEQILNAILPLEIVGKTSNGQLVIGQGAKTVAVGDMYTVFGLGETVTDTRTGEVLDEIENELGIVQIVRVSEKVSYAVAVSGEAAAMAVGSRLRRYEAPQEPAQAEPSPLPATTLQIDPSSGAVVLPLGK